MVKKHSPERTLKLVYSAPKNVETTGNNALLPDNDTALTPSSIPSQRIPDAGEGDVHILGLARKEDFTIAGLGKQAIQLLGAAFAVALNETGGLLQHVGVSIETRIAGNQGDSSGQS